MTEKTGNSEYGTKTLEVISEAYNFNHWMYKTILPYCRGNILEAGSGIGNISYFFVNGGSDITLSDYDSDYFPQLKQKFGDFPNMKGIHQIDLSDKYLETKYPELMGKYDTVFALNVVEHIEDHEQALQNAFKLLKTGGQFVILVPAFQWLYNGFDEQLGHYRRYTQGSLEKLLKNAGFQVVHSQYFNFIAIVGWFFSGNVLRKRIIPTGQMRFYNALVPVWKVIDLFVSRFAGISVIQVGKKI